MVWLLLKVIEKINMSRISASIVLYKTEEKQLEQLLSCVSRSGLINQVYLIDNSPNPVESNLFHLSFVKYIKSTKNVGYGAGHNIALRESILSNDFHFVLNPDIYFEPIEISKMINKMAKDKNIGQLMPKVYYPDGELQYLCKLLPTPFDLFFRLFSVGPLKNFAVNRRNNFELRFTGYKKEMNIPYLSGCFMLFRTSALKVVGLFDERFFMYPEDVDITRRMHAKYKTIFYPGAVIVHDHAKESYKSKKMLWIHVVNMIKYFNKWGWFFDAEREKVNVIVIESLRKKFL
jgi:GT2 family glycosyltransferase